MTQLAPMIGKIAQRVVKKYLCLQPIQNRVPAMQLADFPSNGGHQRLGTNQLSIDPREHARLRPFKFFSRWIDRRLARLSPLGGTPHSCCKPMSSPLLAVLRSRQGRNR